MEINNLHVSFEIAEAGMGRDLDGWTVAHMITLYHLQKLFRTHSMGGSDRDRFSGYFFGKESSESRNIFVDTEFSLLSFPTCVQF